MLASIFGKVTSSLGKTYVFSGLLPAGIFLLAVGTFYTSFGALLQFGQQQLSLPDAWKSVSAAGAIWIALGFIFYAVRTRFFGLFEIIPVSGLGRKLLFRRLSKRGRAQRDLERHEWRATACRWIIDWNFAFDKIGDLPEWLRLESPQKDVLLASSQRGRKIVTDVERTVGGVLSVRVRQVDAIISGVFALYRLVCDPRWSRGLPWVANEIEEWRKVAGSVAGRDIIRLVRDDVLRSVDKAFAERGKFGDEHYVFPTALGDLISALDDYGQDRYGIDTTTMWDRVWWILPKEVKADVSDARLSVETLINLIFALGLTGAVIIANQVASCGFGYDAMTSCMPLRAVGWIAACWVLALMAYGGARFAMEVLASKIASLVDCYRLAALAQLGFAPKTIGEEQDILRQLKGFFTQATRLDSALAIAAAKSEAKAEKAGKDEEKADQKDNEEKDKKGGEEGKDKDNKASVTDPSDPPAAEGGDQPVST